MLKIWLPFNEDFRNIGLLNLQGIPITTATTIVDGGKFKCLQAGNGSQVTNGVTIGTNLVSELGRKFSASIWVKPNGTHVHYNGTFISSGNWNTPNGRWTFGVSQDNTKVDVFGPNYNTYIDCTVPVGQWTHLVSTFDDGIGKVYKNGEFVGQRDFSTAVFSSDTTSFCVGRETYANGYFSFNGNIADLRIYNDVLTEDKVRELSKAKLFEIKKDFHYEPNTNLLDYSNIRGHGSSFELTSEIFNGSAVYRNTVTSPNAGNNAGFAIRQPITAAGLSSATKISISFYKKLVSVYGKNLGGYIRVVKSDATEASYSWSYNKPSWANDSQSIGEWEYITSTVTIPTGCTQIKYVYVYTDKATGGVCDYSKIQLELNATPTQYCLGHRDEILFDANGTNGIQYSSGVVKSGSTLYFDGTNSYIQTSELDFMKIVDSAYTFSFWVNSQEAASSRSVYFGGGNQGNGWTFNLERFASSNKFRIYNNQAPDWTVDGCVITTNTWIHIVITRSGNTVTVYKNGVSVGTKTGFTNHTSFDRTYYIGSDYRSGDTRFKGYIGNFKIYANPFTADDVLKLYNKEKTRYQ